MDHYGLIDAAADAGVEEEAEGEVTFEDTGPGGWLTATVLVELENRARCECTRHASTAGPCCPTGTLDVDSTQRAAVNAIDRVLKALAPTRHERHRRRVEIQPAPLPGETTLEPTYDRLTFLVAIPERAGITPALTRRLLHRP